MVPFWVRGRRLRLGRNTGDSARSGLRIVLIVMLSLASLIVVAGQTVAYLAAHRIGYPGTGSRLLFYELDKLRRGDEVILKGRGETYRYRISGTLVVDSSDSWVMGQAVGRDMVTLQTCTPIPTYEKRLVVRADRI